MNQIPSLESYIDLIKKAEFDINRYSEGFNDPYSLLDCLLTLNAIPEWIINSENANNELKKIAKLKLKVMKNWKFQLNEELLETEIDHQLNFLRRICNQNKHNEDKSLPNIELVYGGTLNGYLPLKFYNYISIGAKRIDVEIILKRILAFWKEKI